MTDHIVSTGTYPRNDSFSPESQYKLIKNQTPIPEHVSLPESMINNSTEQSSHAIIELSNSQIPSGPKS